MFTKFSPKFKICNQTGRNPRDLSSVTEMLQYLGLLFHILSKCSVATMRISEVGQLLSDLDLSDAVDNLL